MSMAGKFTLFVAAYGITLLATAPASLLGPWVERWTQGAVALADVRGTIWHGSAVPVLYAKDARPVPSQRLDWRLSLIRIGRGEIELLVSQGRQSPAQPTQIDIGAKNVELRHVVFEMPATVLEELNPLLRAIKPQGTLHLKSDHLVIAVGSLQGTATVTWQSAGSPVSIINPLGDYSISLDGSGSKIAIGLSTIAGPLLLDGHGDWSAADGLALQVRARARAGSRDALAELLHHLGPQIAPDTRLIRIGRAI